MGLGFGVLKQMSDTFKHNRDLLGKKKSVREIYKEEIKKRGTTADKQNLEFVRLRVAKALRRNRSQELFASLMAVLTLVALVSGIIWVFINIDFTTPKKNKYENKAALFSTIIYEHTNGLKLKTDYYHGGPKASEAYLKDGMKHQNSESYYESGEQFRSALYNYDTLVTDIYFYKSGDTITNFPAKYDQKVYQITLHDNARGKKIEFDFYDGKIIQGTYKEQ
jgi:hypothetical protein